MGAAKAAGGIATMFPSGSAYDAPWDLSHAVSEALIVLGYFERPEKEQPPPELWHHTTRLDEWFRSIKQNREDEKNGMEPVPQADNPEYLKLREKLTKMGK